MHGCTAHTDLIRNIAPGLPDARLFRIKLQVLSSRGTFPTRPAPSGSVFHMENTRSTTEWLSIRGSSCPDITVLEVHSFHRQMQYDQDLRAVIANLTLETPKDGSDSASVHACQVW